MTTAGRHDSERHEESGTASQVPSGPSTAQRIGAVAVWVLLIASYLYYIRSRDVSPLQAAERLRTVLVDNWWGPALFITAYVARPLVLFPASVLTIVGGLAFGLYWGTAWTVIASNLSTLTAYTAGRFLLSGVLGERLLGLTGRLGRRAQAHPFETTAIMRLLYLPFDAVGYLSGFLRLRLLPFMAGSFLGTLPGTVAFVGFGASVDSLSDGTPDFDIRILAASLTLVVLGSIVKSRMEKGYMAASSEETIQPQGERS